MINTLDWLRFRQATLEGEVDAIDKHLKPMQEELHHIRVLIDILEHGIPREC